MPGCRLSSNPCLGKTPLFFSIDPADAQVAKAICADCASRLPCLDRGILEGHEDGIWGGLDLDERRAVTASRRGGTRLIARA